MDSVQHGDSWWRQGDDGTWYRWNEGARAWEFGPREDAPGAPPAAASSPAAAAGSYRSPRGVARALTILLGTTGVLDLVAIAVFFAEFRRWDAAVRGATVTDAELAAADLRVAVLSFIMLTVLVATAVIFIVWFHRLYTNLPALGAGELRFGRGWAIGSWFVPVLNLWRPKQIANDIWRGSDPQASASVGTPWHERPVSLGVHLWWGLYLLSNLVNWAIVLQAPAEGAAQLRTQALADTAAAALDAASTFAALWLVVQMTARHERRAAIVHPM